MDIFKMSVKKYADRVAAYERVTLRKYLRRLDLDSGRGLPEHLYLDMGSAQLCEEIRLHGYDPEPVLLKAHSEIVERIIGGR